MGKLTDFNYLVIGRLYFSNMKVLSTTEHEIIPSDKTSNSIMTDEIILPSKIPNQEELLIKQQSFEQLSKEAQFLITMIANADDSFIELFETPQRARLSKALLKESLYKSWKSKVLINKIWKEIQEWIDETLQ